MENSTFVVVAKQKLPFNVLNQVRKSHELIEKEFDLKTQSRLGTYHFNSSIIEKTMEIGRLKLRLLGSSKINNSKITDIRINP